MTPFTVLIVAKAPVPGLAKTRLCPPLTHSGAADVAAAALLDTLEVAQRAVDGDRSRVVLSFTGSLAEAARRDELDNASGGCHLVAQRGDTFGERLANAHLDAAALSAGSPVIQIGMDTPQSTPDQLIEAARVVADHQLGVIGDAGDGGWWLLGLPDASAARALTDVPMSRPDTGLLTRKALARSGVELADITALSDVDTWQDALEVASGHPDTRFADAVRLHGAAAGANV
jgi:glycosyltransferase A (GT-A) superfamily protein (DUF2064 family)